MVLSLEISAVAQRPLIIVFCAVAPKYTHG
jgi:hypothetical protein